MELVVSNTEQELIKPVIRQRPTPLASRVTDEDRAAHAAFVSTLGNAAIWRDYQEPKPETQAA
jgi:DNA polymerase-3 subunit epsilon